jgi:PST family polysaccharide transporter
MDVGSVTTGSKTAGLAAQTASAAQWRFGSAIGGALAQFCIGVLLARLVRPADFGAIALASFFIGFIQPFSDLGIGAALVQRKELTVRHLRAALTASLLLGGGMAIAVASMAGLAARAVAVPSVGPVLRLLSAVFVIQATATVASAILRRRLDYRRRFLIDIASYIVGYGFVAATLALQGYGVWSLAWGSLAQATVSTLALNAVARPSWSPLLARREVGQLLHFGIASAANTCVNFGARNVDNVIVGRLLGASALGFYSRAYSLMNLPFTYAVSVMTAVLFPALSQLQDDAHRLRRAFLRLTVATAAIAAPCMVILAISAPHLIAGVYGEAWLAAVVPLQILCAAGYFRALYHVGGIVSQSAGRIRAELRNQVMYAALVVAGASLGAIDGLRGVAVGVAVAILAMFVLTARVALNATATSWKAYLECQVPAIMIGVTCSAVALTAEALLTGAHAAALLTAAGVAATALVPAAGGLLWILSADEYRAITESMPRIVRPIIDAVRSFRKTSNFPLARVDL